MENESTGLVAFIGLVAVCHVVVSIVVGRVAHDKGRHFWLGFLLSFFLGPVLGGLILGLLQVARYASLKVTQHKNDSTRLPFRRRWVSLGAWLSKFPGLCKKDTPRIAAISLGVLTALAIWVCPPTQRQLAGNIAVAGSTAISQGADREVWVKIPDWQSTFGIFGIDCLATAIVLAGNPGPKKRTRVKNRKP